ncbi:MAG: acyl-CoA thioesterase [Flavobacteriales bacterium]|nr:acyl-CoA thioesterase [Flavobacteriales bacterium]
MYSHSTFRRVTYAETDKMGYLYYGRYADYFETGRVEALRALGFVYKELEDSGIMMPVLDMQIRYRKPAFYDELLEIQTRIPVLPSVRIEFDYRIVNPQGKLLTEGKTTLVFYDRIKKRPCECPEDMKAMLSGFFTEK